MIFATVASKVLARAGIDILPAFRFKSRCPEIVPFCSHHFMFKDPFSLSADIGLGLKLSV